MRHRVVIFVGLLAVILLMLILLRRQDDGMTRVQRDIHRSLERARGLKAQRDSLAQAVEAKRFGKSFPVQDTAEKKISVADKQVDEVPAKSVRLVASDPVEEIGPVNLLAHPQNLASLPAERFYTTSGMDGMTPVDRKNVFEPGASVYIYAGVHAPQKEELNLEWLDASGKVIAGPERITVESNTGINGYRIYKQRKFRKPGEYSVRVTNSAEEVIGRTEFTISE